MANKTNRKNLGRGLSALIPDADMAFLSQVARGEPIEPILRKKAKLSSTIKNSHQTELRSPLEVQNVAPQESLAAQNPHNGSSVSVDTNGESGNISAMPGAIADQSLDVKIDMVAVELIEANPYQPRRTFSATELAELADSVREHGLLQPIILRPSKTLDNETSINEHAASPLNRYQLIAGERRWRAAQAAGLSEIPAIIRQVSDQQALELALIENVQRHDISALDSAIAYRRLSQEFSLSQEQVAQRVGKSRSAVANTIRLLDLPVEAQRALDEGILSEGHGRAILLASSDGARRAVLRRILRDKLSVRDAEELARQAANEIKSATDDEKPGIKSSASAEAKKIESSLQKHFGTRVKLQTRRQGGNLVIQYFSNEELDRILKLLLK